MAVGSWSSCSSSTSSLGSSFDDVVIVKPPPDAAAHTADEDGGGGGSASVVKFLCSYGGKILPRHTDGALRYVGGDNRVLSLDRRRLRFHDLLWKLSEVCGWEVRQVRCQLPTEDLDALVSVTTDADLASVLEVYDDAAAATQHGRRLSPLKIRAFLFAPRTTTAPEPPPPSPPLSSGSSSSTSPSMSSGRTAAANSSPNAAAAAHVLRRQQNNVSWANAAAPTYYAPPPRWWEQQAAPARADLLALQRPPPQHCHRHGHGARPPHRGCLVHHGSHWQ